MEGLIGTVGNWLRRFRLSTPMLTKTCDPDSFHKNPLLMRLPPIFGCAVGPERVARGIEKNEVDRTGHRQGKRGMVSEGWRWKVEKQVGDNVCDALRK